MAPQARRSTLRPADLARQVGLCVHEIRMGNGEFGISLASTTAFRSMTVLSTFTRTIPPFSWPATLFSAPAVGAARPRGDRWAMLLFARANRLANPGAGNRRPLCNTRVPLSRDEGLPQPAKKRTLLPVIAHAQRATALK